MDGVMRLHRGCGPVAALGVHWGAFLFERVTGRTVRWHTHGCGISLQRAPVNSLKRSVKDILLASLAAEPLGLGGVPLMLGLAAWNPLTCSVSRRTCSSSAGTAVLWRYMPCAAQIGSLLSWSAGSLPSKNASTMASRSFTPLLCASSPSTGLNDCRCSLARESSVCLAVAILAIVSLASASVRAAR